MKLKELIENLGYTFNNKTLLEQALRHRSMGKVSNERLEFLGDAILSFIIAAELFQRYPDIKEGELSRLRANLVNGEALAELATELQIGKHLQFGSGELRGGGAGRKSILADAMEAIIGAIYIDSGFADCERQVLKWFASRLNETTGVAQKDPKTCLQELLQMRKLPLPIYTVVETSGAAHSRVFTVSCQVTSVKETTTGVGSNKRVAERAAAKTMLEKMGIISRDK
jgi:ribonuclease III